eukprot:TRINITY_DN432_c0_g1_i1.p1 TRINITY_DN432_c0_g1~~TRINITY_DN432_c0_g1_i1.p1  ORF type:complete len:762 (-),score=171.22 TRINITY_DN432_c0_g1_i1:146-2386(-)
MEERAGEKAVFNIVKAAVHESFGVALSQKDEEQMLDKLTVNKDFESFDHNIAFPTYLLAKQPELAKKKPKEANFQDYCSQLGQQILPALVKQVEAGNSAIEKVIVEGVYLNFYYKPGFIGSILPSILLETFIAKKASVNERVMIEYSQPNTHKTFHVGHMRNAALGDSLIRLYEWIGYDVIAANYIGDVGAHIAKCLWYYLNFEPKKSSKIEENIPSGCSRVEWLGGMYAKACDELDFTRWTKFPYPGYISAVVESIEVHPGNPKWKVVVVRTSESNTFKVVSPAKGLEVGHIVVYAPVGTRKGGRLVQEVDMKGVLSVGCVLSEKELDVGTDNEKIFILEKGTPIGQEVTELTRYPNISLSADIKIADEMKKRTTQVNEVLKALEAKEPETTQLWEITRQWSIDDFKTIYSYLDCRFDHYFHESDVGEESKEMVIDAYNKGQLVKSEGAIGADLKKWNLGFSILLTSAGTGLYATKDLALAKRKFEDFKIERSIYVVDGSQSLHFKQVFKTLEVLGFKQAAKCFHLDYGLVTLKTGKMSSRKGNIIAFTQLKEQLSSKIDKDFMQKYREEGSKKWSEEAIQEVIKKIAISTIKYGMLNQDPKKDIIFDMDAWTSKTGNTGPYLMYAYARTRSILRKVVITDEEKTQHNLVLDPSLLSTEYERKILSIMSLFPETVEKAAEGYRPQSLCIYLYTLARLFSRMFEAVSVKTAEPLLLKYNRLALVDAVGVILKAGLSLLGISVSEKM